MTIKSKLPHKIEFNLVTNAQDSICHAVGLLAWKDIANDGSRMKQAIINVAHGVELLLKERLRRVGPALIWEDIDKYPKLDARTVTVEKAIHRLRSIGGVTISEADEKLVKSLRNTRNAIEHFEWSTTIHEAKLIVGTALSFVISFSEHELGLDMRYEFRKDDTWVQLISELYSFTRAHGERVEARLRETGLMPVCCAECGELTVIHGRSECHLCGHWNIDPDELPY